eukprot:scaffold4267_cov61-Phaeocystis_antarctica.AAC.4
MAAEEVDVEPGAVPSPRAREAALPRYTRQPVRASKASIGDSPLAAAFASVPANMSKLGSNLSGTTERRCSSHAAQRSGRRRRQIAVMRTPCPLSPSLSPSLILRRCPLSAQRSGGTLRDGASACGGGRIREPATGS